MAMESEQPEQPVDSTGRSQIVGWVAFGALVVGSCVLAFVFAVVNRPGPGPYADGTVHEATADCTVAFGCRVTIGAPGHVKWNGLTSGPIAPTGWDGHQVDGSLTIVHNWGMTDGKPSAATFTADGVTVTLWGGRPDDTHPPLPS
jgi:hypothetical protein